MSRRSRRYGLVERVVDRRPCVAHHLHDALVHLPGALGWDVHVERRSAADGDEV